MGRTPRPFAGQRFDGRAPQAEPTPATTFPSAMAAPVAPETVPAEPIHEVAPQREAWEAIIEETAAPYAAPEQIVEAYPEVRARSVTDEVAQIDAPREAPPVFTELSLDFDQAGLRSSELKPVAAPDPEETAEVPAYVEQVEEEVPPQLPSRRVFETPVFVAPTSHPVAESLIDEVDAAFITAGLPSGNDAVSEHAARAAEMLERIARRLRSGEVRLQTASESNTGGGSEEAALAAVLAALLANR